MPELAQERVEVGARVIEELPGALFRLRLEQGRRPEVTAHVAPESGLLRVLPGENVVVQLSSRDGSRGRIVRRA